MATLPERMPHWKAARTVRCSGCNILLYSRGVMAPNVETSLVEMSGDQQQITVVTKAVVWHNRKDCKNPGEFGAKISYDEEP